MKRKTTIITEEFDDKEKLVKRTTETTEEEDTGFIYPQIPYAPDPYRYPTDWNNPIYKTEVTCGGVDELSGIKYGKWDKDYQ